MAFQFPSSPVLGQTITNPTSSVIYTWNGVAWASTPVTASRAITSSYANSGGSVTISDTAPSGVGTGSLWLNSNNMGLYVNYYDTDGAQWVATSTPGPVITASYAASASAAVTSQTSTNAITASYVINTTVAYAIPDTFFTPQWILLGTWTTTQDGQTLRMNISAHSGYNALNTQLQATDLYIATSNGISTSSLAVGGAFYATGLASIDPRLGTSTFAPSLIRVVQVSVNSYQVYAYFGSFSNKSHYTVSVTPGTTWTNAGILPGTTPGGTYLDITPVDGMCYANFSFNTFPTTNGTDFTPIIGEANGITVSGAIITIANPGTYYLVASIGIRSTYAEYGWYTTGNQQRAGTINGVSISANSTDPASATVAAGITTFTNPNAQIKLRMVNQSGAQNTYQGYSSAQIIQLR